MCEISSSRIDNHSNLNSKRFISFEYMYIYTFIHKEFEIKLGFIVISN